MVSTGREVLSLELQGESLLWFIYFFFVSVYTGDMQEKYDVILGSQLTM